MKTPDRRAARLVSWGNPTLQATRSPETERAARVESPTQATGGRRASSSGQMPATGLSSASEDANDEDGGSLFLVVKARRQPHGGGHNAPAAVDRRARRPGGRVLAGFGRHEHGDAACRPRALFGDAYGMGLL